MKTLHAILLIAVILVLAAVNSSSAQTPADSTKTHIVVKHDGVEFIGTIISQDAREVLISTKTVGDVIIPKHEIKEIREVQTNEFTATGQYVPNEVFSTRYFLTTNGLPIEKGESYVLWSLYGPDFQFGVAKNFGVGIMTTWVACPIIVSAKYSFKLSKGASLGIGALAGTGSWTRPDFAMAVPFTALTFGDRKANITFSLGYGAITYKQEQYNPSTTYFTEERVSDNRVLFSTAFMLKVSRQLSFVFDTFVIPEGRAYQATEYNYVYDENTGYTNAVPYTTTKKRQAFALVIPGMRWQMDSKRAFQFGFTGVKAEGEWMPLPIPMVQWFRKI